VTTDGFLSRAEVDHLAEELSHISDIEREMAIALTGMPARQSSGARRPQPGSRPPYPLHIDAMLIELDTKLGAAVAHVAAARGIDSAGTSGSLAAKAAWLTRYRFALSMMDDAGDTFDALCSVIDRARRMMNHIEPDPISPARVGAANRQLVTAWQVEKLAHKLGERGKGLNRQRISRLMHKGALHPVGGGTADTYLFQLGDVLAAHDASPRRRSCGRSA